MALASHIAYSSAMTQPHRPVGPGDHVFLVDGSSFVFRAYYQSIRQDQKYNYRLDRLPTGAIRLFATKILQFVREGAAGIKPTHLAIIFDKSEESFRREIYPDYKSHRTEPPADLVPQFPLMRATVRAFGMIPIEQDIYEADDLIATYARQARERGAEVLIVSADKDLMQLIEPGVAMYDPASGEAGAKGSREERRIGIAEVMEYFGVGPDKVVDVQALAGDSTDNVPGAPGIGVKTAAQLINEFGDLETLLARASEIKQPKRREALTLPENVERIRISKKLVTLERNVAVETPLDELATPVLDGKELVAFLKAMEFTTITRRVGEICGVDVSKIEPDPRFVGPAGWRGRNGEAALAAEQEAKAAEAPPATAPEAAARGATPADLVKARASEARAPIDRATYKTVRTPEELGAWIVRAHEEGVVALRAEISSQDPLQAELIGLSLAVKPNEACYVPIGHRSRADDLFGEGLAPDQMREEEAIALLKPLLEAPGVLKIGQDVKFATQVLAQRFVTLAPIDDLTLISYALDGGATENGHGKDSLSERILGHKSIPFSEVAGSGRNFIGFARAPIDKATEYAAEDADVTLRLWRALKPRLAAERMSTVYETLERPLVHGTGAHGAAWRRHRPGRCCRGSQAISPSAWADFEDGGDAAGRPRRSTSAARSRSATCCSARWACREASGRRRGLVDRRRSVLEHLAAEGHPLPRLLLDWRQLSKLKGDLHRRAGRARQPADRARPHLYALASTTTGRLSSTSPNLQNIPVRTEEGRKIRQAFVAEPGNVLISADYSQIELRLSPISPTSRR